MTRRTAASGGSEERPHSAIMVVVPAWRTLDLIEDGWEADFDEFANRESDVEEHAISDSVEFDAFADLTRKLTRVPRSDIDAERNKKK